VTIALELRGKKPSAGQSLTCELSLKLEQGARQAPIGANGAPTRDSQMKAVDLGEGGDA
jgi:hypothetical protein